MSTLRVVSSPAPARAASARLTPIPELPMSSAATNTAAASAASSSKPRRGARSALGELMLWRPHRLTGAVSVAHGGRALWQTLSDMSDVIDSDGFRSNVGIVLMHGDEVFLGRRTGGGGAAVSPGGGGRGGGPRPTPYPERHEE